MLTPETLKSIELLLPAEDPLTRLLRRAVAVLADRAGESSLAHLADALERPPQRLHLSLTPWDGIRWDGHGDAVRARLAPWVRKAIGLPVTKQELLTDLGEASQDDDEPSAYHRPAPLQAIFCGMPVYTTEDVDALLNGPRYVTTRSGRTMPAPDGSV